MRLAFNDNYKWNVCTEERLPCSQHWSLKFTPALLERISSYLFIPESNRPYLPWQIGDFWTKRFLVCLKWKYIIICLGKLHQTIWEWISQFHSVLESYRLYDCLNHAHTEQYTAHCTWLVAELIMHAVHSVNLQYTQIKYKLISKTRPTRLCVVIHEYYNSILFFLAWMCNHDISKKKTSYSKHNVVISKNHSQLSYNHSM